jgi:hypothetical protein
MSGLRELSKLGVIVCEAGKVECDHIVLHHSVDSNVVHYSSPSIFPERRVNYTRRCAQGRDAPESAYPRQTELRTVLVITEPLLVAERIWVK